MILRDREILDIFKSGLGKEYSWFHYNDFILPLKKLDIEFYENCIEIV